MGLTVSDTIQELMDVQLPANTSVGALLDRGDVTAEELSSGAGLEREQAEDIINRIGRIGTME